MLFLKDTVWVCGAMGKIGSHLVSVLDTTRYNVLATDDELDICDLDAVERFMAANRPSIVINCVGLDAASCEKNPIEAYRVNALGARNLAIASADIHARIVHLSSDDVFDDGTDECVNEFDTPHPLTIYGKSKLAGEQMVREFNREHIIIRSSWVYGASEYGLLSHMVQASANATKLAIPQDQFAAPTSIDTYTTFILDVIESAEKGIFHVSCDGFCSRYEFAQKAAELLGLRSDCIEPISEPNRAYTIELENLMLKMMSDYAMPTWEKDLAEFVAKHHDEICNQ